MKTKVLILMAAAMLLTVPACKKQGKWTKHTVTEEYVFADGQNEQAKEAEKAPRLWGFTARHLVKDALNEQKIINDPVVAPIKVGFYECKDATEREKLYKAQVNGLLSVNYTELKNSYEQPTYWVEVALLPRGKALVVRDKTPIFPEDTINPDYMRQVINPESGMNQYGEYTFDENVDEEAVELIRNFYINYMLNGNAAINTFGTPDMIQAQQRIQTALDLGIKRLNEDPFLRNVEKDTALIADIEIKKWTSYVDLYVVTIGEKRFCIVLKEANGALRFDDIALQAPEYLNRNKTLRCTAMNIKAKEMHDALKEKEKQPAPKKVAIKEEVEITEEEEPVMSLLFDEYNPQLKPGIEAVQHDEMIPYELAKECAHTEDVKLLAGEYKFKSLGKIKDVKGGNKEKPTKTALVTIERTKVSPMGRIVFNMKQGETKVYEATFVYEDEEWTCTINERR